MLPGQFFPLKLIPKQVTIYEKFNLILFKILIIVAIMMLLLVIIFYYNYVILCVIMCYTFREIIKIIKRLKNKSFIKYTNMFYLFLIRNK